MNITYRILPLHDGYGCFFCATEPGYPDINDVFPVSDPESDPTQEIIAWVNKIRSLPKPPTKSSILTNLEDRKNTLKWAVVHYIRANPSDPDLDIFLSSIPWNDGGLVLAILRAYAVEASNQGYGTLAGETRDDCWSLIIYLVEHMTDEEIADALK